MEPIGDFSWMRQMFVGKVRERFMFDDFRAVGIEIPDRERVNSPYRYRLLFFNGSTDKPVLSLNLESSILGSHCLTEHAGEQHLTLESVNHEMTYEEFRDVALSRAKSDLH